MEVMKKILKQMKLMKQAVEAVVEQARHHENGVNAVALTTVGTTNKDSKCTLKMQLRQVCDRPRAN